MNEALILKQQIKALTRIITRSCIAPCSPRRSCIANLCKLCFNAWGEDPVALAEPVPGSPETGEETAYPHTPTESGDVEMLAEELDLGRFLEHKEELLEEKIEEDQVQSPEYEPFSLVSPADAEAVLMRMRVVSF